VPLIVFARVGWMRWYRGPQADDEKPVGGGKYNNEAIGHEAFNFQPHRDEMLGFFQPKLPRYTDDKNQRSHIALERIQSGFSGESLNKVMVVYVATDPLRGGQRIVGWYRSSTVYRFPQESKLNTRNSFDYFVRAPASPDNAVLIPYGQREHIIPSGKGAFGQANVCYYLDSEGRAKGAQWIFEALEYVSSYQRENVVEDGASETDGTVAGMVASTMEQAAGFQSDPKIRKAIEDYAMQRAKQHLENLGFTVHDCHKTKPYDFLCRRGKETLYLEVKGMQDNGKAVSLTPREVDHAQTHINSALFIVHSVVVRGDKKPVVSGGIDKFVNLWDISKGILKPRSFVHTLPE
jgi:hypothetical protein